MTPEKSEFVRYLLLGVPAYSFLSLFLYWFDKRIAKSNEELLVTESRRQGQEAPGARTYSRVPELLLLSMDIQGGWPGSFLGQSWFRHKLRKTEFMRSFWANVILHISICLAAVAQLFLGADLLSWFSLDSLRDWRFLCLAACVGGLVFLARSRMPFAIAVGLLLIALLKQPALYFRVYWVLLLLFSLGSTVVVCIRSLRK